MSLEYISYSEYKNRGFDLSKIKEFDCGVDSFNSFLQENIELWERKLSGVTYFLIDSDLSDPQEVVIYAFATLSTIGLLKKDNNGERYISGVEIRLFAVHDRFRGICDEYGTLYSHIFFALLLQDLWTAANSIISFQMIFLQANEMGKSLYKDFGFIEVTDYIAPTEEDKIEVEDCIPMICSISDELMYKAFNE